MGALKKLAGETAIYGLSSIIGRVLNYLLVPLYTSYFLREQMGVVSLLYAYSAFFIIVYTYGMETSYFRFATKMPEQKNSIYNSSLSAIILTSVLFSGLLIAFADPISSFVGVQGHPEYIFWFACIYAVDAIVSIPFARLRLEGKAKKFALIKISNILLNIFLVVFFIVLCPILLETKLGSSLISGWYMPEGGPRYVFLANLIANGMLVPMLWSELRAFKFSLNFEKYLKPMLSYGIPLIFIGLAGVVNNQAPIIMLEKYIPEGLYPGSSNIDIVGVFGACSKLAIFMQLAIQAFRYASEPFFFSRAKDKKSPELFAKVMRYFVVFGVIAFVGISTNLDILASLFLTNKIYWTGLDVVPYLLIANLLLGVYFNLSIWFKLTEKTKYGSYISLAGSLITIVGNIILIPMYGYMGSAYVMLVAYGFMVVVSYVLGQKYFPIPYDIVSMFAYLGVGIAVVYVSTTYQFDQFLLKKAVDLSLGLIFLFFIFLVEKRQFKIIKDINLRN
ncbi:oligosaccharide flippase family protein [Aureibacter tunicatorum]|uniref:O-antigen/teichoic acid export membrane protein n=1 Tax=Aureibacter tunicatorum TaxID=866807 RepID=A0AAE3XJ69_9BACT|nr:oligosaccharide flippase family protein [Aureibacter tunicatorum]MDR6237723.1 O-antigen/teichoic acid export membrane protein [Aureibacter tunicatorum]BDD02758.1 polysaccharide biosynthesis protein [Aureibacter tunicatorum]